MIDHKSEQTQSLSNLGKQKIFKMKTVCIGLFGGSVVCFAASLSEANTSRFDFVDLFDTRKTIFLFIAFIMAFTLSIVIPDRLFMSSKKLHSTSIDQMLSLYLPSFMVELILLDVASVLLTALTFMSHRAEFAVVLFSLIAFRFYLLFPRSQNLVKKLRVNE